jgi:hypothetical protein
MAPAFADDIPALSGMALIAGTSFLVVHDVKAGQTGSHMGVLTVSEEHGLLYERLETDWGTMPANDLESASTLPGRPGEFLVAESGSWTDITTGELHQGRVFHIKVWSSENHWKAERVGQIPLPMELHEVEGIAVFEIKPQDMALPSGDPRLNLGWTEAPQLTEAQAAAVLATPPPYLCHLVFGTRGGEVAFGSGRLFWGTANLTDHTLEFDWLSTEGEDIDLASKRYDPWLRSITDLYVDAEGRLWVSSAVDNGDFGMFHSYVTRLDDFAPWNDYNYFSYDPFTMGWTIWGYKIEALAAPVLPNSFVSLGTDDEAYGGTWRPLGEMSNSRY